MKPNQTQTNTGTADNGATTTTRASHADTYPNQMHIDFWSKCVFPPVRFVGLCVGFYIIWTEGSEGRNRRLSLGPAECYTNDDTKRRGD